MLLLDASSLYMLIREGDMDILPGVLAEARIIPLTDYELGNTLWKERLLRRHLSANEVQQLATHAAYVLRTVQRVSIQPESFEEVLRLAVGERLSYYDASYVQTAKQLKFTLATEDDALAQRARKYAKTINAERVLQAIGKRDETPIADKPPRDAEP